jgi:ArsR family transcriptional regulator
LTDRRLSIYRRSSTNFDLWRAMDQAEAIFKALSDPIRLRILALLNRPEAECCSDEDRVCACDLEKLIGLSQPTISHHMKILVQSGLVLAEKSGRWVYYRIHRAAFAEAIAYLGAFAGEEARLPKAPPGRRSLRRATASVG